MKQTVTHLSQFFEAFKRCGRGEQFSYEALGLIYDYIEDYEQDSGEEIELDVIALCCEWAEEDATTLAQYYSFDVEGLEGEALHDAVIEAMQDATQVAGVTDSGSIVYVQF